MYVLHVVAWMVAGIALCSMWDEQVNNSTEAAPTPNSKKLVETTVGWGLGAAALLIAIVLLCIWKCLPVYGLFRQTARLIQRPSRRRGHDNRDRDTVWIKVLPRGEETTETRSSVPDSSESSPMEGSPADNLLASKQSPEQASGDADEEVNVDREQSPEHCSADVDKEYNTDRDSPSDLEQGCNSPVKSDE